MFWNQKNITKDLFVGFKKDDMENKINSILSYKTQDHRFYSKNINLITEYCRLESIFVPEYDYAESFEVIKIQI